MTFKNIPVEIPGWDYDYQKVDANTYEDFFRFYEAKGSLSFFTAKKLTLQKKLADMDMIILRGFERATVVSERMKAAIEKEKLNGAEFKAVPFDVQFA